jgi:glycosyltransferase involved in cell wall biosynthesis
MAKPIVATRMSDLPEVLDNCGLLVEPGDVAQLAAAIERLLHDEPLAAELGGRAREACVRWYSWDAMDAILTPLLARFT